MTDHFVSAMERIWMIHDKPRREPRRSRPSRPLSFDTLGSRVLMTARVTPTRLGRSLAVDRDVVYRNEAGDRQTLDVYRGSGPAPEGGRPVLIAIHGGGWTRFDKSLYGRQIAGFTRHGFVVVAPNYRLSRPGRPSWPTNLEDVRESVRWVRRNADHLGVDPDRVAAIGESSGGHLAEMLGTAPDTALSMSENGVSSRVDAVVSFAGPSNLATLRAKSPSAASRARRFLGASPDQAPDLYAQASPLAQVSPDDAPTFLVHGSADRVVPVSQSVALANRLRSQGVATRLVVIPGAPHEITLNEPGRHLSRSILRFLRNVMP